MNQYYARFDQLETVVSLSVDVMRIKYNNLSALRAILLRCHCRFS